MMASDANGKVGPGMYFVGAFGGKAKASGKDFGRVTVVVVGDRGGEVVEMWCDRDVAERAGRNFRVFDPVSIQTEETVFGGKLGARLVEVSPR
jgi:hypothetical protein